MLMIGCLASKVEGVLAVNRRLYSVMAPNAEIVLNELFDRFARALVGMPPWQPSCWAHWELGWGLQGFARAVLDTACRRARIQAWPPVDWCLKVLLATSSAPALGQAAAGSCSSTAAFCDFIEGDVSAGIRAYKHYVQEALQHICTERAQRRMAASSQAVVLVNAFPVRGPRQVPKQILRFPMNWDTWLATRSVCRLRLHLLVLGAKSGRLSRARVASCVICGWQQP